MRDAYTGTFSTAKPEDNLRDIGAIRLANRTGNRFGQRLFVGDRDDACCGPIGSSKFDSVGSGLRTT